MQPLYDITTLIEIDAENNPLSSFIDIVEVVHNKKDILVYNIKQCPLICSI